MGKYDINFKRLITYYLPVSLRGNLVEFLFVLLKPLRRLHFLFLKHVDDTDEKLSYNSQYPNLQRLLNDQCDPVERGIQVRDNGGNIDWTLIYPNAELKPLVMPFVIYPASQYGYQPFTVHVPEGVFNANENKLKRLLNQYKFAGTKYKIIVE
ncbi:MAG: hypothetical protein LBQ64_01860 [Bacteroidales bacterium]|jgi:hypothetical protein|nr:hypothetical protein [Bacteroidales bacterium]